MTPCWNAHARWILFICAGALLLVQPGHPAVGVGEGAALDSRQGVTQRHRHLAGFAVTDGELPIAVLDPADRGDDGGGTAGEHLGYLAGGGLLPPLVDVDLSL